FWKHHRDDCRLYRCRDLERFTKQYCRSFRGKVVHAAELAAGDGISLVDFLRHRRHVFRGDFVPDWPRALAAESGLAMYRSVSVAATGSPQDESVQYADLWPLLQNGPQGRSHSFEFSLIGAEI